MSREAELYRDKIEVSLDGRQIFYLFFGGAVIVGLVFVLGVMVGRRVEARGHVERAHTAATVDPLAALDRLDAAGGLSFQGSLRGKEPPPSVVEKKIEALAVANAGLRPQASGLRPDKVEKVEKVADKKLDEKKAEDKKTEDKKTEDKKTEDKKTEDKKTEDKKTEDKKTASKENKVEDKHDSDSPKSDKHRYTLQLSSFQDKGEAQAFLDSIKSSGYQAYLTQGEVDGKQYFRIRLGSYKTLDAANDAKSDFEKSAKKSALVTKL